MATRSGRAVPREIGSDDSTAHPSKARAPVRVTVDLEAISNVLGLSLRESQIVDLVLIDESEQAIAARLGISAHTVHSHLERLYRKLAVRSRCALVIKLFQTWVEMGAPRRALAPPSGRP